METGVIRMPKRVLIAGLFHETHTFLDGTTGLRDFAVLRGDDMLARLGGDEFLIVMPTSGSELTLQITQRLMHVKHHVTM